MTLFSEACFPTSFLYTPGGIAFGLVEEQIGRSHWAGIAKEREKLVNGSLGSGSIPFLVPLSGPSHARSRGVKSLSLTHPHPLQGALSEGGRLDQSVGSEVWLSQKPPNHKAAVAWVGRCPCCGCLHRKPGGLELHLQCPHLFPKVLPTFTPQVPSMTFS